MTVHRIAGPPEFHDGGDDTLDVLLVGESPAWPMRQGFCVHGTQMARALAARGYRVGISTYLNGAATQPGMPEWLASLMRPWPKPTSYDLAEAGSAWGAGVRGRWRYRLADHQGVDVAAAAGVLRLAQRYRPRLVLSLAQHGSMLLQPLKRLHPEIGCLWYAADDPVRFQLSCLRREAMLGPSVWRQRGRMLAVFTLLQRLFTREIDGAIGVCETDARWLRATAGLPCACCVPNGVDLDYYRPEPDALPAQPDSLVFWGRMDFEPNADAVCWFAKEVWPRLKWQRPGAPWWIAGKPPRPEVQRLAETAGIEVVGEVDDVRPWAHRAAVTVLPMRLGTGIKNKLLEASAMRRPIVASRRAVRGLSLPASENERPFRLADDRLDWEHVVRSLWDDPAAAASLGARARQWVGEHHGWDTAADRLLAWVKPWLGMADVATEGRTSDRRLAA